MSEPTSASAEAREPSERAELERRGEEPVIEGVPLRMLAWLDARIEARLTAEPGGKRAAPSHIVRAAEAHERARVGLEASRHEAAREALTVTMEVEALRLAESDEPDVELVPLTLAYSRARKAERLRLEVAPPEPVDLAALAEAIADRPAPALSSPALPALPSTSSTSTSRALSSLSSTSAPATSAPPTSSATSAPLPLGATPLEPGPLGLPALVGAPPLASTPVIGAPLDEPAARGASGMPSHLRGAPRPSFMLEREPSVNAPSPPAPSVRAALEPPAPPPLLAPLSTGAPHAPREGAWSAAATEPTLLGSDPGAPGEELPFKPGVALLPLSAASPPRPVGEATTEEVDSSLFRAALPFSRREVGPISAPSTTPSPSSGAARSAGPLTLEAHASLSAELHAHPHLTEQAYRRHGLAEPASRQPADAAMKAYLATRPDETARWRALYQAALERLRQGR